MSTENVSSYPIEKEPIRRERRPLPQKPPHIQNQIINRQLDFVEGDVGFHSGSQKRSNSEQVLWMLLSLTIDGLLLISLSSFFILMFVVMMKTSAREVVLALIGEPRVSFVFVVLLFVLFWSYLVMTRVFHGATIGEQTCSLRLGKPVQRFKSDYILRVILRTTLTMLSGVFVLPFISILIGRDIAGTLSGLKIYSLK